MKVKDEKWAKDKRELISIFEMKNSRDNTFITKVDVKRFPEKVIAKA